MTLSLAAPSPLRQQRAAVTGPILLGKEDPFAAALGEVTSPSDTHAALGQHFSTLDYLGLADGDSHGRGAEANGGVGDRPVSQNGSSFSSRNRASTVSNFARPLGPSSEEYGQAAHVGDEYGAHGHDVNDMTHAMDQMGMYETYDHEGYYDSAGGAHRPRATTIGPLDNPRQTRGYAGGISPAASAAYGNMNPNLAINLGPYGTSYLHAQALQGGYHNPNPLGVYPPRTRADHLMGTGMSHANSHSRSRDGMGRHGTWMSGSSHTSRTGTPMQDLDMRGGASTPQMPTRSLWIGNLDVTASQETLLRVFAPYGPIESVRLLPEKVCLPAIHSTRFFRLQSGY